MNRSSAVSTLLALIVSGLPVAGACPARYSGGERVLETPNDLRATGRRGAVVSAHPLATAIGLEVLKEGGNAADAAVATALALAVVHPQAGNLGGGGFLLFHEASGKDHALDFREKAPRRASRDMFLDGKGRVRTGASLWTARASGVPGSPAGLEALHRRFGTRTWKSLVAPAIRLAREGFVIDPFLARAIRAKRRVFAKWEATARIFLPEGKPLAEGALLVQPDLARTLEDLAEGGAEAFYRGRAGKRLAEWMRRQGGLIDEKDLTDYSVVWRRPIRVRYRGFRVLSMPPPSSGGVALSQMLAFMEPFDVRGAGFGSAACLHRMIEAMRRAYADRAKWLGDPDFYPVPLEGLLAPAYLKKMLEGYSPKRARPEVPAGNPRAFLRESKETTHFSILDPRGNAVSCTTTLNSSFGNGQVVPGAGFFLNNEMDDFSAKPWAPNQFGLVGAEANAIAPGKRMLSSMTPAIVLGPEGKRVVLVLGSPGGGRIINTVFQVLLNVLDHRLPLHLAVSAPRIHEQWRPVEVFWEPMALAPEVRKELERRGHRFAPSPATIGRCQAVLRRPDGRIEAAADPRSGGAAGAF